LRRVCPLRGAAAAAGPPRAEMLRDDPIVLRYPEFLPTEEEVGLTERLLRSPENRHLWEALCQTVCIGDCPTSTLRRFCWQAREERLFGEACAAGAKDWLCRCLEARERLKMDSMLGSDPFPASFRELYTATVPFSFHGTDRQGHPVYIVRYGSVDVAAFRRLWAAGEQLASAAGLAVNGVVLFHLRAMEYLTKVVMRDETQRQGRVVDRILTIMDVGGLGLQHLDGTLKDFLAAISKESVPLFPETLHAAVVAHAPWVVSKAAWPLARRFMHPVTQAKFAILTSAREVQAKLLEDIEPESLPPYFGGRCKCRECSSGQLRGGSLWTWENEPAPVVQLAAAERVAQPHGSVSPRAWMRKPRHSISEGMCCDGLLCWERDGQQADAAAALLPPLPPARPEPAAGPGAPTTQASLAPPDAAVARPRGARPAAALATILALVVAATALAAALLPLPRGLLAILKPPLRVLAAALALILFKSAVARSWRQNGGPSHGARSP